MQETEPQDVFVNYTHPSQQRNSQQRQKVASYIGTYYRNRSRPTARRDTGLEDIGKEEQTTSQNETGRQTSPLRVHRWRLQSRMISPLQSHDMHGLKVDPFNSYPIPDTGRIPRVLDYFFEAYGPTHLVRSHLPGGDYPKQLLQSYLRYAMQHPAMFESIVTLALADMNVSSLSTTLPDLETSFHYGSTLSRLREILETEEGMHHDATIQAILGLIGAEFLLGNVAAYYAHIQGLMYIIRHRGGLDKIGWQEVTNPVIIGLIARCRFFSTFSSGQSQSMNRVRNVLADIGLEFPTPAAPSVVPDAELVPGLQTLNLEGRFSSPVVLIARAVLAKPVINLRSGSPMTKTSLSVELTEYLEYLLGHGRRSLEDGILLMSLHHDLLDLEAPKKYNAFYHDICQHWTQESLAMIDKVKVDDEALVNMFIWTISKHGNTLPHQPLNVASDDSIERRFQLMMLTMNKYWQMRDWKILQGLLWQFDPSNDCMHRCYQTWQSVRKEYDQP